QEAEAAGRGSRGLFLEDPQGSTYQYETFQAALQEMWALELRDELTSLWNQRGRVTAAMGWILQTQEQQEAEMRLAQKARHDAATNTEDRPANRVVPSP
ncbi:unnamed protein product, partial [Symbiodinium microadriaticum]